MEKVIGNLRQILDGKSFSESSEFCDFSLADQNEVASSRGMSPSAPASFRPVVKQTVTYIVAAVLINDHGEVLMMQEAKSSCRGQWYLPAGRMESGEDITEAVKREVLEETGMMFEPKTLLLVETAGGAWYRFVMTGNVTGGKLKTTSESDSESLQAKWVSDLKELKLRAPDVVPLVDRGRHYATRKPDEPWHLPQLPDLWPHDKLLLRLVIVVRKKADNKPHVLMSEKTALHLPTCEINPARSIHSTLKKYLIEIFGADLPQHRSHGLLSIEHHGKPSQANDGCCLTLLISVRVPLESVCLIDKYHWTDVEQNLRDEILSRLSKNMTVPLIILR